MSQRISGYIRKADESYETTVAWPVAALLSQLDDIGLAWDCCDRNSGALVATLRHHGVSAIGTVQDFFAMTAPPPAVRRSADDPLCHAGGGGERQRRAEAESVMTNSPVFIAKFADSQTTRLTTYTELDKLDVKRGVRLSQWAYRSRMKCEPPAIVAASFELNGTTLASYDAATVEKWSVP